MSQTVFAFDPPARLSARIATSRPEPPRPAATAAPDPIAFAIGWDHARYGITPPATLLHQANPVRQGWSAGRSAFAGRRRAATPVVHDWLDLRLQAWRLGVAFEDVQVTPHFLAQIAATHCPVTGKALTRTAGADDQATIVRLNDEAAFAAGNLAVLSLRAARELARLRQHASGAQVVQEALGRAAQADVPTVDGRGQELSASQWQRLAAMCSYTTAVPDSMLAELPLSVLPPNRVRVLQPLQALQVVLTLLFCQNGYARTLCDLAARLPAGASRRAFQVFMHTLLARRLSEGAVLTRADARVAMLRAWTHPLVCQRWRALAGVLDRAMAGQLVQRTLRSGDSLAGCTWLDPELATQGWALDAPAPCLSGERAEDLLAMH
ncbi:MAG: hypothetical protein L6Q73_04920 [Aquabacterium sp.]|nr:hypothetical protein [Aquabacterium sp.]